MYTNVLIYWEKLISTRFSLIFTDSCGKAANMPGWCSHKEGCDFWNTCISRLSLPTTVAEVQSCLMSHSLFVPSDHSNVSPTSTLRSQFQSISLTKFPFQHAPSCQPSSTPPQGVAAHTPHDHTAALHCVPACLWVPVLLTQCPSHYLATPRLLTCHEGCWVKTGIEGFCKEQATL